MKNSRREDLRRVRGDKNQCPAAYDVIRYDRGFLPVKFYLKRYSPQDKKSQIVLAVTVLGTRFRICTGMKIEPAFWDRDEQRCYDTELLCARVRRRTKEVNALLDRMVRKIKVTDLTLAERGQFLTAGHIRRIIADTVQPARNKQASDPMTTLRKIAEDYPERLNSRGLKGAASSSRTYLMALKRLERFTEETGFAVKDFGCFNREFFDRFKNYLVGHQFTKGGTPQKYTSNTVLNTIRIINNLTLKAYEMNLGGDSYYKGDCSILHESAMKIYLNERELKKLGRVKTKDLHESGIRDMFLIASYTALRISDINKLNAATFTEDSVVLNQTKTKNGVCVPILKEIGAIVHKYRKDGFPKLDYAQANSCIKELAKRAGINEVLLISEIRGGDKIFKKVPKYSQVSFHTARRSCITNLYKRGYGINYLMSLSGHKSIASFQRYIKSDAREMSLEFIKELKKRQDI